MKWRRRWPGFGEDIYGLSSLLVFEHNIVASQRPPVIARVKVVAVWEDTPDQRIVKALVMEAFSQSE